ncbi:MAG: hypothetical protein E7005_01245 [Alphaproteobacteria bacterium]|nr:hypothetical protein [Alphaproteobacteria bacterium]
MSSKKDILKDIKKILENNYGVEDTSKITNDTSLRDDLDFDSLEILDFILTLEHQYQLDIDSCDVAEIRKISDIVDLLFEYINKTGKATISKETTSKVVKALEKELKEFSKTSNKTMVIEITKEDADLTYSVKTY